MSAFRRSFRIRSNLIYTITSSTLILDLTPHWESRYPLHTRVVWSAQRDRCAMWEAASAAAAARLPPTPSVEKRELLAAVASPGAVYRTPELLYEPVKASQLDAVRILDENPNRAAWLLLSLKPPRKALPAQAPAQAPAQPAQHSIKELSETLPQALIDWLLNPRTQGGDEWPIPPDLLRMFDDLVVKADALVRERDPRWRIWHGNKCLRLKAWTWDSEPPPYWRPRKPSKRYP